MSLPLNLRMAERSLTTALLCLAFGCAQVGGSGGSSRDGGAAPPASDARAQDLPSIGNDASANDASANDAPPGPCVNLQCRQVKCDGGATTSVSGTVFAPNGKLPLYNVAVYVPNAPLEPFPAGVTCDRCGTPVSGKPIVSTLSNSEGKFKLLNVPTGMNVPLVFQVGKWRRKVTVPNINACQDTALVDPNMTRLPRNRTEGDLPKIAVTSGDCDQLGCLLPKLGIDTNELGVAGQDTSATYFVSTSTLPTAPPPDLRYGPANMRPALELWNDEAALSKYDLTLLSCECGETLETKSATSFRAMNNYLAKGGRIFGSHYSYVWLQNSPDMQLTAAVAIDPRAARFALSPLKVDTSFPKGKALADWMKFLDPAIVYGDITSDQTFDNVRSVMPPSARTWASSPSTSIPPTPPPVLPPGIPLPDAGPPGPPLPAQPRIITVNTPAGMPSDKQCGRAVHLDVHIVKTSTTMVPANSVFPVTCGTNLTKGEEALAFLFFDLAACIQDDTKPVVPPIIVE